MKEKTSNTKIVGVFYGYVIELSWDRFSIAQSGHLAIDRIFSSPHIDFISSPTSYTDRRPGEGYSIFMSLTDSLRYHGKLWMDENDIKTFKSRGPQDFFGKMDTFEGSRSQQWREVGNVLSHGVGMWWFDMSGGWYADPGLLAEMKRMLGEGRRALEVSYASAAQVAVVVDPRTSAYLRYEDTLHQMVHARAKREWGPHVRPLRAAQPLRLHDRHRRSL